MSKTGRLSVAPVLDPALTVAKDERVQEIALRMATGDWHPYRSPIEVAKAKGLSPHTVANDAKEAARLLRLSWADDGARVALLERIQTLGAEAAARTEEVLDREGRHVTVRKPDYRSAIQAATVVANILGMTKQQHEVRVAYESMTDEQIASEVEKFLNRSAVETAAEEVSEDEQPAHGAARAAVHDDQP